MNKDFPPYIDFERLNFESTIRELRKENHRLRMEVAVANGKHLVFFLYACFIAVAACLFTAYTVEGWAWENAVKLCSKGFSM